MSLLLCISDITLDSGCIGDDIYSVFTSPLWGQQPKVNEIEGVILTQEYPLRKAPDHQNETKMTKKRDFIYGVEDCIRLFC